MSESLANYTFSVNPLRLLAALLASRGIPAEPLFAAHGITTAMLDHTEARIPLITARRLWTEAERMTGDRDLGLSVGEEGPLGAGVIAYAAQASATLGAAFRTLCRFHRLVTDAATVALILEGSRARLVLHTGGADGDPLPRHVAEMYLALWVRGGRQLTGVQLGARCSALPPCAAAEHRQARTRVPRAAVLRRVGGRDRARSIAARAAAKERRSAPGGHSRALRRGAAVADAAERRLCRRGAAGSGELAA